MWGTAMGSGVRLRLHGLMPEKFIRMALTEGIRIYDCRRIDAHLSELHVSRRDAQRVCRLAQQYHMQCDELGSEGASALAERLLKRRTALAGVLMMLCTAAFLLSRVWMVQVLPVDNVSEDVLAQVHQALADGGAAPGAALWHVDRAGMRSRIISSVPQVGYVAVKRQGVCIVAEVSEAVAAPSTYDIGAARDVVAMYDGVVQRVDVYAGTAAVQPGDAVRRGDVLIRGEERTSAETTVPVAADGAVIARIWQSTEVRQPAQRKELTPTGRQSVTERLVLPGRDSAAAKENVYAAEMRETEFLPIGGLFLPVGICRTTHIECEEILIRQDEEALKRMIMTQAEAILDKNMPFHAVVVDKWQDYSMINSGELYMKLTRELEADIAAAGRAEQQEENNWNPIASPNT